MIPYTPEELRKAKMPKEFENEYHNSGHKKELIEIIAKIIHEKWLHDMELQVDNSLTEEFYGWDALTENERDVNRQWAIRILDKIFCGGL